MLQKLSEVASPATWAILSVASVFLLAGFVLLSHSLVRSKAHGDEYTGVAQPGRLEWTLRVGTGCVLAGLALWGWEWGWPGPVMIALLALTGGAFGLEAVARARQG